MIELTRDFIFDKLKIQKKDYALASYILKQLMKSKEANGPEFLQAILSEINQPYTAGYHMGFNGWQTFARINPAMYEKVKWAMWKKVYKDASERVCARMEFKPIGEVVALTTEEILAKSLMDSGNGDLI